MRRDTQQAPGIHRVYTLDIIESERGDTRADDDTDNPVIEFKAASARPIWRGWSVDDYLEVINLKPSHLAWLKSGNAPCLWMHNSREPVGLITKAWLKKDDDGYKVLHVKVQFFGEDEESMRCYKRVKSGLLKNVSIGWSTKRGGYQWDQVEHPDNADEQVDQLTFNEISIKEVSFVSMPADETVGIGRDDSTENSEIFRSRSSSMDPKKTRKGQDNPEDTEDRHNPEGTRWLADNEAKLRKKGLTQDQVTELREFVDGEEKGMSAERVQAKVFEIMDDDDDADPKDKGTRTGEPEDEPTGFNPAGSRWLSDNETKLRKMRFTDDQITKLREFVDGEKNGMTAERVQAKAWGMLDDADENGNGRAAPQIMARTDATFDCSRAARMLALGGGRGLDGVDGIEHEVLTEFENHIYGDQRTAWGPERGQNSIMIPHSAILADSACRSVMMRGLPKHLVERAKNLFSREEYSVGATPAGFHHEVFDETWFVEALIAHAKLLPKLTILPGQLVQDMVGVVESGEVTVLHTTESGTIAESAGLSFGNRMIEWHQVTARKDVTRRTLDQSRMFFPRLLQVLQRDVVRAQNKALINGQSAKNQPVGILNYTGLPLITIAAAGGNPVYDTYVDMYTQVEANNALMGMPCFALTPEIKGRAQKTPRFAGSQGDAGDKIVTGQPNNSARDIDGFEVITENNLPKNLSKGASGNVLHAMIFGNFADIELGMFSGVEVMTDPYSGMENSKIRTYVRQAYDMIPRHVNSFVACVEAKK